jgi:hypothetical protein
MEYYSVPVIGLTYILIKILVKFYIYKAIEHEFDFWDVLAWFSLDIMLLSLSVCVALDVPSQKWNLKPIASYFFYIIFVVFCITNGFCYLYFTKRRDQLEKIPPIKDLKLASLLSVSWAIGFYWFWGIFDALKQ